MTKQCLMCAEIKPLEDFNQGAIWCKPCRNSYYRQKYAEGYKFRERQWQQENREKCREYSRKWRAKE